MFAYITLTACMQAGRQAPTYSRTVWTPVKSDMTRRSTSQRGTATYNCEPNFRVQVLSLCNFKAIVNGNTCGKSVETAKDKPRGEVQLSA